MEQMQEMRADRVVVGFDPDATAMMGIMMPVKQHRSERGHQAIGDIARARVIVIMRLGQNTAECRYAASQNIHRMRGRRQQFSVCSTPMGSPRSPFSLAL